MHDLLLYLRQLQAGDDNRQLGDGAVSRALLCGHKPVDLRYGGGSHLRTVAAGSINRELGDHGHVHAIPRRARELFKGASRLEEARALCWYRGEDGRSPRSWPLT